MQALATNFTDESGKEMGLCPICKVNFVTEDEAVCTTCIIETDLTEDELDARFGNAAAVDEDDAKEEETLSDGDEDEEMEIISLSEMGEEGDDEEDETDEENSSDPLDDFDDSYVDEDEDDEEEEEEADEDEDEDK
jgi:hypothetical protein